MKSIVLTGGGTSGHCQPNINLLPYLQAKFDKIYYIGSNGIEKDVVKNANIPYYQITTTKLIRKFCKQNLLIPYKLIKGINEAKNILKNLQPNVVFSKGGYVSLPVVIASKKLGIPVVSHESDYSIGLANKIGAKYSKIVLTSFRDTANHLTNGEFVGSPLRPISKIDKKSALKRFNLNDNLPILLIIGGSLGCHAINSAVYDNLDKLLEKYNVLHLTGKNDYTGKGIDGRYHQESFILDMDYAYSIANIALSRAGANVLFELTNNLIPSLIVPLPKGNSRGDQIENANYFASYNMIKSVQESDLSAHLIEFLDCVSKSARLYKQNMKKYGTPNACQKIAEILYQYS